MIRHLYIVAIACLTAGCATSGRMSLLDIDFRTPAQIQASQMEALAPYIEVNTNSVRGVEKKVEAPKVWWKTVFDWVGSMAQMRLRVLPIEWSK